MLKKRAIANKKNFMPVTLIVLVIQMDAWIDGKVHAVSKNAVLVMKLAMFQKKQSPPGWSGINLRVLIEKYFEHGQVWLCFSTLCLKIY